MLRREEDDSIAHILLFNIECKGTTDVGEMIKLHFRLNFISISLS